jgi:hypothetical protein
MGVALMTLTTQLTDTLVLFQLVLTVPFIIGFSMLYVSLFR